MLHYSLREILVCGRTVTHIKHTLLCECMCISHSYVATCTPAAVLPSCDCISYEYRSHWSRLAALHCPTKAGGWSTFSLVSSWTGMIKLAFNSWTLNCLFVHPSPNSPNYWWLITLLSMSSSAVKQLASPWLLIASTCWAVHANASA